MLPEELLAPEPHLQSLLGPAVPYLAHAGLPQALMQQLGVVVQLSSAVVIKVGPGARAGAAGAWRIALAMLGSWLVGVQVAVLLHLHHAALATYVCST
jgi:hypothetical protein